MLLSPASPKVERPSPLASVTSPTVGATEMAASRVVVVRLGATTSGRQLMNQIDEFACW
jgi:hypothetical protein